VSDVDILRDQLVALASLLESGHLDGLEIITAGARSFAPASVLVYGDEQTGPNLAVSLRLSPKESYRAETGRNPQHRWVSEWAGVPVELTVADKGGESA
jgi:hypothetical protein